MLSFGLFLPISPLLICWYIIVSIFIIIDYVLIVINICFDTREEEYVEYHFYNYFLFIIILLDIPVSLNTGFITRGKLIMDRKQSIFKYLKSVYFIVDVWSALWALIQLFLRSVLEETDDFLAALILVKFLKLARIDSLVRMYILRSSSASLYYEILKNFVLLTMVCHFFGSFFFFLDTVLVKNGWYSED